MKTNIIYIIFLAAFAYFLVLTAYYIFLALIGAIDSVRRMFEGKTEDYAPLFFSDFKIPVTIIMPARNEEEWISDSVKAVLNLDYPEFELIVVNDGSQDKTMEILSSLLKLKAIDSVYVKHYRGSPVREVLKSQLYDNVTVINEETGNKKAGALNAGLNLAKYDHVCIVDADTILEQDSLLKVMAHAAKDPDLILGLSSYFGLVNGFKVRDGLILEHSSSWNPIVAYQNMEYIRSFFGNRMAWSRYDAMPNVAGGFGIWRKDFLYETGGFSPDFTCEDIELTFRAYDYSARHKDKKYRICMLPYNVGWTEGPSNIPALISQRNRWQRVVDETVWQYKYMFCNPKFGAFGFLVMPYYVAYEVLGVFVELGCIAAAAIGWLMGILQFKIFIAFFLFMVLTQAFITLLSILSFVESQRIFKMRYIAYLMFLALVELFCYRWIIAIAKIMGTIGFFRKKRAYDQYDRPRRV